MRLGAAGRHAGCGGGGGGGGLCGARRGFANDVEGLEEGSALKNPEERQRLVDAEEAAKARDASPDFVVPEGDAPPPPVRARTKGDEKAARPAYTLAEAVAGVKANAKAKFVETVDIAVRLGIDPKRSDMIVRGVAILPHGTGKKIRVCVFAEGEQADEARAAGADVVGGDELIAQIKEMGAGAIDFDKAIAHPAIMPKLSAIARVLGPRGMMPNPKVGPARVEITSLTQLSRPNRTAFDFREQAPVNL